MIYEGNFRFGDLFKSRKEKGRAGLPTLSVTMNYGLIDRDQLERKQDTTLTPQEHLLVRPGDIAYNMMRMWQGAFGLASYEGIVSPAYVVLKPTKRIDPEFASYLLKTPRYLYLMWAYSYGLTSDRLRLYYADFSKIPVSIPSLDKQIDFAHKIRLWDKAIKIAELLSKNAKSQKKAAIQKLIPKIAANESAPDGWRIARLGDFACVNPRRNIRPKGGLVSFVPMDAVSENGRLIDIYERKYEEVRSGYTVFLDGDLLVAKITPCFENGKGALISGLRNGVGFGSTEFHVLRSISDINFRMVSHVVNSYEFRRRGASEMEGSAGQKRISADFIRSFKFVCPLSISAQEKIADMLDSLDETINSCDRLVALLKEEKEGVMKHLLRATVDC